MTFSSYYRSYANVNNMDGSRICSCEVSYRLLRLSIKNLNILSRGRMYHSRRHIKMFEIWLLRPIASFLCTSFKRSSSLIDLTYACIVSRQARPYCHHLCLRKRTLVSIRRKRITKKMYIACAHWYIRYSSRQLASFPLRHC